MADSSSSDPSIYVRVKRKKTTIFLMVEPSDTAADLKIKIHHITKVPTTDMKLYVDAKGEVQMDENKSLTDQKASRTMPLPIFLLVPQRSSAAHGEFCCGGRSRATMCCT